MAVHVHLLRASDRRFAIDAVYMYYRYPDQTTHCSDDSLLLSSTNNPRMGIISLQTSSFREADGTEAITANAISLGCLLLRTFSYPARAPRW